MGKKPGKEALQGSEEGGKRQRTSVETEGALVGSFGHRLTPTDSNVRDNEAQG